MSFANLVLKHVFCLYIPPGERIVRKMGKTHTAKLKARQERLAKLPRSERLSKSAVIKKKEGRILNASEKHAVKMSGDYGAIMAAWEELRTEADRKHKEGEDEFAGKIAAVDKVMKLIKPQFETASRTPSMSRAIQSCIKHGSPAQLETILELLSNNFVKSCSDAYCHFVVCALLRHANRNLFRKMLNLILANMSTLVGHKFGALVVHTAFTSKMCSAVDRDIIILGVFKDSVAVMKQWKGYPVLEQIMENEPVHRKRLITALFALLDKLVSQKEGFGYTFVQRLLCAFFKHGGKHEIQELAVTLKEHVAILCDTREGSMLTAQLIAVLPPAQRKDALNSFRTSEGGVVNLLPRSFPER